MTDHRLKEAIRAAQLAGYDVRQRGEFIMLYRNGLIAARVYRDNFIEQYEIEAGAR